MRTVIELSDHLRERFGDEKPFEAISRIEGKIYRRHKNRRTVFFTHGGKGYFVKIHRPIGWGEIMKNLIQLKWPVIGAHTEYRAIRELERLRIPTMKIAGFGMRGIRPAWLESFLITEALSDTVSIETLTRQWQTLPPDFSFKTALIRRIAEIARCLHQNGINHRDFYICHFLIRENEIGKAPPREGPRLYLIDLHRVQIRAKAPQRWIVKDLAGLLFSGMDIGLTSRDLMRFMRIYRANPLRVILDEERSFWLRVYRRAAGLYRRHYGHFPNPFLADRALRDKEMKHG